MVFVYPNETNRFRSESTPVISAMPSRAASGRLESTDHQHNRACASAWNSPRVTLPAVRLKWAHWAVASGPSCDTAAVAVQVKKLKADARLSKDFSSLQVQIPEHGFTNSASERWRRPTQCVHCRARLPEGSQAGAAEHDPPLLPGAITAPPHRTLGCPFGLLPGLRPDLLVHVEVQAAEGIRKAQVLPQKPRECELSKA